MKSYQVIIPTKLRPSPARYEISAATLLANHFKADVEFMLRSNLKTPDFLIESVTWELKSLERLLLIDKNKNVIELTK